MDNRQSEILYLKGLTEQKLGHGLRTPNDFNKLIMMIQASSGETISLSTLKRLWGYVAYPHRPSLTVLSILARFNGFKDWDDLCESKTDTTAIDNTDKSDVLTSGHISAADIAEGECFIIEWGNDKSCTLEKIAGCKFNVIQTENIQLHSGDTIFCLDFCMGQPFYASEVEHHGKQIGSYLGCRSTGGIKAIIRNVKL